MSFTHTCEKGDSMPKIAAEYGFADYNTIWQRPENDALRGQRDNPNVLAAGDQVYIPDKQPKTVQAATGAKHSYTLKGKSTHLRIKILDFAGSPLKSASLQLTVDGQTSTVTTDGDGLLDQVVPPDASSATLKGDTIGELQILIGTLDPVDEEAGLRERLHNLGYLVASDDVNVGEEDLKFGIELFQADNKLPIDGSDTASVQDKLKEIYGC